MKILHTFRRNSPLLAGLILWVCTNTVHAQAVGLQECRAIEDRLERFDCYEMLEVDSPTMSPDSGSDGSPGGAQANNVQPDRAPETFGMEEDAEPASEERSLFRRLLPFGLGGDDEEGESDTRSASAEPPREAEGEVTAFGSSEDQQARLEQDQAGRVELVDTVAKLEMFGHKQWRITLEGGQIWTQMLSETYNLREGYEVRISPVDRGRYYRLSSPELAGYIQVRRLE